MSELRKTQRQAHYSWLTQRAEKAVADQRVFLYLALVITAVSVGAGFLAHLIDRTDFPTLGTGVWWAVVTVSTVGYGDVVPHTTWGRVLGGGVILFGVTFISFLIAVVTSVFFDARRAERDEAQASRAEETEALLRDINTRLAAIEKRLGTETNP